MSRVIMLIPINKSAGLDIISLGLIYAFKRKAIRTSILKIISQKTVDQEVFNSINDTQNIECSVFCSEQTFMDRAVSLIDSNQQDSLMEEVIDFFYKKNKNMDIVIIEGIPPTSKHPFVNVLNNKIAKMLNAEIVFVLGLERESYDQLKQRIYLMYSSFGGDKNKNIAGVIINTLCTLINKHNSTNMNILEVFNDFGSMSSINNIITKKSFKNTLPIILGFIPWKDDLIVARAIDVANYLHAKIINKGDIQSRLITSIIFCSGNLPNTIEKFRSDSLLVLSGNYYEVLISACLAVMNGIKIGAIILTDGYDINPNIKLLCYHAFQTGLPVFTVQTSILKTFLNLQSFSFKSAVTDPIQINKIKSYVFEHINNEWINSFLISKKNLSYSLSPPAFRYRLTKLACQANKCIVLPEGEEPRIIKAADICTKRDIAKCILLGNPENIYRIAETHGIKLEKEVNIIDTRFCSEKYVSRLVELRKLKGMTNTLAREQLKDNVMLATLMLEKGEVDGLVSGAIHTTADTIRPSLQLIKTSPGSSLISSILFMLFPEQVLIYGDCAINPDPTSNQLAEIAIQSANSAKIFGIEPRIAMISYSTGNSGSGASVEKVRAATNLVRKIRPDLIIDGPLQYDAAVVADVAISKAPNSIVAGKANVFIFPDLNTGNTTYKAVQRSANLISIGPMLQGIRKPVNDLSRGALVDDIIYTIAITAIQSK